MKTLSLKSNHRAIREYYENVAQITQQLSLHHEGAVAPHFANLLRTCGRALNFTLAEQHAYKTNTTTLRFDGAVLDEYALVHGVWEAKDSRDDLAIEVKKKFAKGYPKENILFQSPERAILYQNGRLIADEDIRRADNLVELLKLFFEYTPPAYEQWEQAVAAFKDTIPELAQSLLTIIETERKQNKRFAAAFESFTELCRQAINPNIADKAVEEMLIQHLLTERIFRTVFKNPDFVRRNIIAREIETVIEALTSRAFSRAAFLGRLDRFYGALEATAATIEDYSQKQTFLNTVYEKFFQGFSTKDADTHGIVYTPQPIVSFMVRSVQDLLQREFGKSLGDPGVHILDPFVGTGNFQLRVMQAIPKTQLPHKYRHELHCNELMLLPYYIASMNLEHEYFDLTGQYEPFEGICLVDTFELAEGRQLPLFVQANTQRVQRQKNSPITVIIGNPPYNAHQVNENDNSKNRKYPVLDQRVAETYAKDSQMTNKVALSDVYIKAFRWAADRIGDEGIVAFVTNNGFVDGLAFDGMRQHLAQDFSAIYVLDMGGNVRKNPKLSGTTHNVFGIQVGVCITFLVKNPQHPRPATLYYARTDEFWRKEEKYNYLDQAQDQRGITWEILQPDVKSTWLTAGMQADFDSFLPMGSKEAKAGNEDALFTTYGRGLATSRDTWAYNFSHIDLAKNMRQTIEVYNEHVLRWNQLMPKPKVDDFVVHDDKKLSWSRDLKLDLKRGNLAEFSKRKIRRSTYRPFVEKYVFFDRIMNEEVYQLPNSFPLSETESENKVICVPGIGGRTPYWCFSTKLIPNLSLTSLDANQCFPFYTYNEDGSNRQENITDWALAQFQAAYPTHHAPRTTPLTKWNIFHYIYALLHHPYYRETYAANLRRELPRIPFLRDFWGFVTAGERLAELHVNYETQLLYPLTYLENPDLPLDYRVEKMRLSRDKTSLTYNDFLTLGNIPSAVYEYKLGNRSALEWVIDQYQVTTDKRSGLSNDPNRPDDPDYILRLIGQVITVSLETVQIVNNLPAWDSIQ